MAANHSYTQDFEDLYNQVQNGFDADNPRPNLNQGYLSQSQASRSGYADPGNTPRPLPSPYGSVQPFDNRPRPLPRPPPTHPIPDMQATQQHSSSSRNTASPPGTTSPQESFSPQQGIKRLPAVPVNGSGYPGYSPSTSSYTGSYFGETPRAETYEKGRGAALYASALPPARRPQPAIPSNGVPAIDVAPANTSPASSPYENRGGSAGTPPGRQDSRYRAQYGGGSPFIPPVGAHHDSKLQADQYSDSNGSYGRAHTRATSHTTRTLSTNTVASTQSGSGSTRYQDSPSGIGSPGQHLLPNASNGQYHSNDYFEADGNGAALLRSSSATSSIGSSYPPIPVGTADRASLSPSGTSQAGSFMSPNRHATPTAYQTLGNATITPSPGPNYEFLPPNGSDVKVSLDSQPQSYDQKTESRDYGEEQELSRRLQQGSRLTDHISDLKQRLRTLEIHDPDQDEFIGEPEDDGYFDEEEEDDSRFMNLALLSHIAVRLRDKVPRATHVKGSIPYPRAFTGKDIVSTIQSIIQRELLITLGISTNDRRIALQVAQSLQNQLFFYEVEWGGRSLSDSVEDVFMFLDDDGDGEADAGPSTITLDGFTELPTGVITLLTKCYSPSCNEGGVCYAYGCPKRGQVTPSLIIGPSPSAEPERVATRRGWKQNVPQEIIDSIGEREVRRQNIIFKMIEKEEHYVQDLDFIDVAFIKALRSANPPVIPRQELDGFIDDVFGNILDLRETNKRLLENLYVRQREQKPVIQKIGDVFLTAAAEFRWAYPIYVGHVPVSEKRLKEETETNAEFRIFLEQAARLPQSRRLDLKHFVSRPCEHLKNYPVLLEAALKETDSENPDVDFLAAASQAIKNLSTVAQLRTFQTGMARNRHGPTEWHQLVSEELLKATSKKDIEKQSTIFEMIYGEMEFVRDLETLETLFVRPLLSAIPPIIPRERLNGFIRDVFWNVNELTAIHRKLLDRLHEIQREEHPFVRSISAPIFDAVLSWPDAYLEYAPHYPIAAFRIQEELANNPAFKAFHDACIRHPDARKLDLKQFVLRPIPRLLRYDLLLRAIMKTLPEGDEDLETIPQILDLVKDLGKATDAGVATATKKVELWNYNANLVFKSGEAIDMDLLDETRTLVHTGRLLRQSDGNLEWSGWTELFIILFDNYLVMTKPKERDGVTTYHANKRPIPLELLSLVGFTEAPQQRSVGLFGRGLRAGGGAGDKNNGADVGAQANGAPEDNRTVWPCNIHHAGRVGGLYHLFAESSAVRTEWKEKLEEAISLRAIVQDSNKVFETRNLSENTFVVPSIIGSASPGWSNDVTFTGKVTCSVPFSTSDGRGLVAVGCAEGVWIGLRSDKNSLRRVLHLKMVTQCAMLEDFGIFLVLADKSLFAYHIEALVPTVHNPNGGGTRTPQKLNGTKDVQFFSVGTLNGRTLIIYMKKKGLDSVFRVLEPVIGKITEKAKAPGTFGRSLFGGSRSEWFRVYRDFFLPSESFDLVFLKAKIAILCTKGFEIMDLTDFKSVTIPQRDDPRLAGLARRCESCRPMGMFRSSENEFLLCYDEFGLYVDRHGDPNRTNGVIEWEGTAERVAFHPPYVVIFDSRFIEIRHIDKGRLVQIIRGTDIRCLWDGRGAAVPPIVNPGPGGWDETSSLDARIHAVMKSPDPQPNTKVVVQHVFELTPTVALYAPPPLSSPPGGQGYPRPGSPPRSPLVNAMHAWR